MPKRFIIVRILTGIWQSKRGLVEVKKYPYTEKNIDNNNDNNNNYSCDNKGKHALHYRHIM